MRAGPWPTAGLEGEEREEPAGRPGGSRKEALPLGPEEREASVGSVEKWIPPGSGAGWCKGPEAGRVMAHQRNWKKPAWGVKGQ